MGRLLSEAGVGPKASPPLRPSTRAVGISRIRAHGWWVPTSPSRRSMCGHSGRSPSARAPDRSCASLQALRRTRTKGRAAIPESAALPRGCKTDRARKEGEGQMRQMIRTVASKVMWVGRATVFMVGLSVILALVLGAATAAFGANGDFFKVGRANFASAVSVLDKSGAGPALRLLVDSGPPLAVNSSARVANLNADKLDGTDSSGLVPKKTYTKVVSADLAANLTATITASCDAGDLLLSGGHANISPSDHIFTEGPVESSNAQSWAFEIRTGPVTSVIDQEAEALCADFGEAHTP